MKFLIIIICAFFFCSACYGKKKNEVFKESLSAKLERLASWEISGDCNSFDPDSLSAIIAKGLTDYFKSKYSKELKIEDSSIIENISPINDTTFQVFTFGYNSGGTAGWISHPIIIKKENGTNRVFNSSNTECSFYDFYKLKDEIYLCIGRATGWGACLNNCIYVIDFKGENIKYIPAFDNKINVTICNSNISFDNEKQILRIESDNLINYNIEDFGFKNFFIEREDDNETIITTLTAKYDGKEFIKP